jgi:hypothetical protein
MRNALDIIGIKIYNITMNRTHYHKMFNFSPINFLSKYSTFRDTRAFFLQKYHIRVNPIIIKLKFKTIKITEKINIFAQLSPSEPKHSFILSNLLNPKGNHGYGNSFLNLFFKVFPITPISISPDDIWEVTAEKERFDIRIRNINNTKIIIIENKSNWANDQDNQIYRYWYNGIYSMQINFRKFGLPVYSKIFYLSPSDYKQPSEQSISRPIDYDKNLPEKIPSDIMDVVYFNDHIIRWLNLCINIVEYKSEMYYYLLQYRDFWR